jgi:HD-GYP domain-containing protein (c-di-GMP phosphodiesterase class II)
MYTEHDFFVIEKEFLKDKKIFPFQVYIFNPVQHNFSLVLNGNRPLTEEINLYIDFFIERGGRLAILKKQKKTFLQAQEMKEYDIPSLRVKELHELEKEQIMYAKLRDIFIEKNGIMNFQNAFGKAILDDNFSFIIEYARVEILAFSVSHSPTASLAIHLAKEHLTTDNFINRVVAVSYFTAKTMNLNDLTVLSDIVVGSYLHHIGFTQLPLNSVRTPLFKLEESQRVFFKKHTILANHLIKRGGLDISERCKKIILDHHERPSGSGYPGEKLSETIEITALLVGAVSHIFEFSSGKITGNKQPLRSVIVNMQNRNFIPGLELDFGDKIFDIIVNIINTDNTDQKKSA